MPQQTSTDAPSQKCTCKWKTQCNNQIKSIFDKSCLCLYFSLFSNIPTVSWLQTGNEFVFNLSYREQIPCSIMQNWQLLWSCGIYNYGNESCQLDSFSHGYTAAETSVNPRIMICQPQDHDLSTPGPCGVWWLIGRFDAFRPKGNGFESHCSCHVGTLGKLFTRSCLWHFGVKLQQCPCCVGSTSE